MISSDEVLRTGVDIRVLPVTNIKFNDYNPNDMEVEVFNLLVEHVKTGGMHQPILVRKDSEGGYSVVDGEHRLRASINAGLDEVVVVVVDYDDDMAKFKTISMNEIRGEYIPLKMAKLLVDLSERFDQAHIARMTGLTEDTMRSLSDLLDVPSIDFDSDATITSLDVSRPIPIHLMLMPDEHGPYEEAMIKAMTLGGPLVTPLLADEVGKYDHAMTTSFGLTGTKLRNVGLATICKVFNALPASQREDLVKQTSVIRETPKEI